MQEKERLTLKEAAEALGTSEVTARRWIKSGKLQAAQPGRKYLIPRSAIEELLQANTLKAEYPSVLDLSDEDFKALVEGSKYEEAGELIRELADYLERRGYPRSGTLEELREYERTHPIEHRRQTRAASRILTLYKWRRGVEKEGRVEDERAQEIAERIPA